MGNQHCRSGFYFKELVRKRNFKNLTKSLAERCQLKECGNFSDVDEDPQSSMESMANAHPRIFVAFRFAHLITILALKAQGM